MICNFREEREKCYLEKTLFKSVWDHLSHLFNALSSNRVKEILEGLPNKHRSVNVGLLNTMLKIVIKLPENKRQ